MQPANVGCKVLVGQEYFGCQKSLEVKEWAVGLYGAQKANMECWYKGQLLTKVIK